MKSITHIHLAIGITVGGALLLVTVALFVPSGEPKQATANHFISEGGGDILEPSTRRALDGVNTITENADGTGSMTLVWAPKQPYAGAVTFNSTTTILGRHVITQAEAEEVVKALIHARSDAIYAAAALKFVAGAGVNETGKLQLEMAADAEARHEKLAELIEKWRKRVEEGKP